MTQFHKGQEVEVLRPVSECSDHAIWRKAKVIHYFDNLSKNAPETYGVQFPDGSRAVFDAEHIRAFVTDAQIAAYIKRIGDQDKAEGIE